MPGSEWDEYIREYNAVRDILRSDIIYKKTKEFLVMLHEKYGLTPAEYMKCILTAFASAGLFIPFHSPEEIILCAQAAIIK